MTVSMAPAKARRFHTCSRLGGRLWVLLNILSVFWLQHRTENSTHVFGINRVFPQPASDLLSSDPNDDTARQRFQGRVQDVATKRGVPVSSLPPVSTWAGVIELDERRR